VTSPILELRLFIQNEDSKNLFNRNKWTEFKQFMASLCLSESIRIIDQIHGLNILL
jgi:hypothetical protein